jgi:hypothetical protein
MRWVTLITGLALSTVANGICSAEPATLPVPGLLAARSYSAIPGTIGVVVLDDSPVNIAIAKHIEDELRRQGRGGPSKSAEATLTFQTDVRREWRHAAHLPDKESLSGSTDLPDLEDRHWERLRGSVDIEAQARLFPFEGRPGSANVEAVVPVYVLTATVDETGTGHRLWQGEITYRGAIASDDATAFNALVPRLVREVGHTVRGDGFRLD